MRWLVSLSQRADFCRAYTAESGGEGILWHKRVSRFKAAEHGDYETWWAAMGANHIEQEKEYVDNLVQIVDIGKDADKKGQSLPGEDLAPSLSSS